MWPQQRWRGAMECYVGLDVSLKQTSICVVNEKGLVVREGVVDSVPEAIAGFVRSKAPGAVRLCTLPYATQRPTVSAVAGPICRCCDLTSAKVPGKLPDVCAVRQESPLQAVRDAIELAFHLMCQ